MTKHGDPAYLGISHLNAIAVGLFAALQSVRAPAKGNVFFAQLPALSVSLTQQPLQILHLQHCTKWIMDKKAFLQGSGWYLM